jgi:glutaredoxin 3
MAKQYLTNKKVSFNDIDISTDPKAAQWVFDHIGQHATPVIDIDGDVILGFDRERIDLSLREKQLI